jgi:hypothetical protein
MKDSLYGWHASMSTRQSLQKDDSKIESEWSFEVLQMIRKLAAKRRGLQPPNPCTKFDRQSGCRLAQT